MAEDYMIVYLNGATPRRRMPGFTWMKKCYQMIDRRYADKEMQCITVIIEAHKHFCFNYISKS